MAEPGSTRGTLPRLRSLLFVPGSRADWLEKGMSSPADGLVLDLEDAVTLDAKAEARQVVADFVAHRGADKPLFVRINELSRRDALDDLLAVGNENLAGVMVPKIESAFEVQFVDKILSWIETEQDIPHGKIRIIPVIETARAVKFAFELADASPRTAYMGPACGQGGDMERAIGYRWTTAGTESAAYRANTLIDLRAAGAPNPMLGIFTDIADLEGLRAFAEHTRTIGYEGMVAIHPSQVPVINEVFSQTEEELEYYQGLVAAMDAAERAGQAAATYRGQMVDIAMATTAQQRLDAAAAERGARS